MSLKEKLERARQNLENSIDSAEELSTDKESHELIESIESIESTETLSLPTEYNENVIELKLLTEDFRFIRETLNENAQNGRRVLRSIASALMDTEDEMKSSLVISFAELNKAIAENIKLYMVTYKTISDVLKNLQEIQLKSNPKKQDNPKEKEVTNISTADILEEIRNSKKESEK